ncbi:MAG TPA: hypothetical protein PK450_05830 [Paracoccaceae bacterium]|nr:hypothetical protein [Paracoccaceae bacterium]
MLEILARSLMIATRADDIDRRVEQDKERQALDQYFWWGRRWHHPEETNH